MKNYDSCKDINSYYFENYLPLSIAMPGFYSADTDEGSAILEIKALIDRQEYSNAVSLAETYLLKFPHAQDALLAWQIYGYWLQGNIPNEAFIDYFQTLEEFLPQEAFLNFNKGFLYTKSKKFNEAVKELEIAYSKNSSFVPTVILLFWIYYLSGDPQWKKLFVYVENSKIIQDQQVRLIKVIESIETKKETSLYVSADSDPKKSITELLYKFPSLIIEKEPTEENILFVAAETKYFRTFVTTFLLSGRELEIRNFGIHVHLYHPSPADVELLKKYDRAYPELKLSYSTEQSSTSFDTQNANYYSSMRFCRAYEILEKSEAVKKISVVDADSLIRANPYGDKNIINSTVLLTGTPEASPGWDRFAGGFVSFSKTKNSLQAFEYFVNIVLKNISKDNAFWFMDQIALLDMYQEFSASGDISTLPGDYIFGKNLQHEAGSLFWTYTNDSKIGDNAVNRERNRLFNAHGLKD